MTTLAATSAFIRPEIGRTDAANWFRMRPVDAEELGKRVRAARAYAGLSNTELAEAVGIGRSTLVKVEAGKRNTRPWELWAIAEVCGVPREFFESEQLEIEALEGAEAEGIVDEAGGLEDPQSEELADEADL